MSAAVAFADWQREAQARVFAGFGESRQVRLERRILRILSDDGSLRTGIAPEMRFVDLHRAIGGRTSSEELTRVVAAMEKAGRIFTRDGRKGGRMVAMRVDGDSFTTSSPVTRKRFNGDPWVTPLGSPRKPA